LRKFDCTGRGERTAILKEYKDFQTLLGWGVHVKRAGLSASMCDVLSFSAVSDLMTAEDDKGVE
jgi:hypothetical protein